MQKVTTFISNYKVIPLFKRLYFLISDNRWKSYEISESDLTFHKKSRNPPFTDIELLLFYLSIIFLLRGAFAHNHICRFSYSYFLHILCLLLSRKWHATIFFHPLCCAMNACFSASSLVCRGNLSFILFSPLK